MAIWELGNFRQLEQPARQPANLSGQPDTKPTQSNNWPFCQPDKLSKHHTPSLIARASPPPPLLSIWGYGGQDRLPDDNSGRRKQRYYYSCSPSLTTSRPSLAPAFANASAGKGSRLGFFSSFAFRYGGLAFFRLRSAPAVSDFILSTRRSIIPFLVGGKSAGRQETRRRLGRLTKQSPFDRKLLNRSSQRNFNFGHFSLSFGSLQLYLS